MTLIEGFFEQTLPQFAVQHGESKAAFIHVDCDLYSATKTIFDQLGDKLQPGCIVVFDEYFNYPDWRLGEYKAFMEYVARTSRSFEYLAYVRTGGQVAVRLS